MLAGKTQNFVGYPTLDKNTWQERTQFFLILYLSSEQVLYIICLI